MDVPSQHAHIAVFTISTCFESSTCYEEKILDNTIFLKESCDLTTGLKSEFMNNYCTMSCYLSSRLNVCVRKFGIVNDCHEDRTHGFDGFLCSYVYVFICTYVCTFYFCLGGFSASAWMTSRGYTSPLNPSQTAELMTELDSQQYLLDTPCDSTAGIYASPTNGWTNGEYDFFLYFYNTANIISKSGLLLSLK